MMKAIFLDVDGIVVTPTSMRLNYLLGRGPERQWYDSVSLAYLGRLVAKTGAVVVLSSTWRTCATGKEPFQQAIMANLFDQLEEAGAPVSDTTPTLPGSDRSAEIGAWLDGHPCETYVILDDLARFEDRAEIGEGHLVLVEDSGGLRHRHYREALALLDQTTR